MITEPVRKRKCGPKTRTGCQTCKIRRVKCDEAKPHCKRCTTTGRKCDGYVQKLSISIPDGRDYTALTQRIATHMPGNSQEKRGFQYFATATSVELSGFFSSSFWEHLILQASAAEPSLRHAVVAIGTLHEEFSHNRLSYDAESESKGQAFAMSQYTKAIGHLRKSLVNGSQAPLTALMSCVLFACFDSLRGYFENAMIHLQSGLKILRDYKARKTAEHRHLVETNIEPLFTRLCIQAILYIDTRSAWERKALVVELTEISADETEIPKIFETLEEARKHMCQAANGLFRVFYMCGGGKPMKSQSLEARKLFVHYTSQLQAWNKSFEKFMAAKSHTFNSKELRGAALLKIHHIISTIMAEITPKEADPRSLAESVNDRENFVGRDNEFRIVANLSRSLIMAAEEDKKMGKPPLTFSTDLGLIGPLYYVCVRAIDQTVRMQCLELLLRVPRREGMWDSHIAVKMIKEYWEIERRHNEMLKIVGGSDSGLDPIPLCESVDLVFSDGMRWEWKWKYPLGGMPVKLKANNGVDFLTMFSDDWKDLLEDQDWFKEDFMMGTGSSPGTGDLPGSGSLPVTGNFWRVPLVRESSSGVESTSAFESESSASPPSLGVPQFAPSGMESTPEFENESSASPPPLGGVPHWVVPMFMPDNPSDSEALGL